MNPSGRLVFALTLVALAGLVLGLATDIGLFGWTFAALVAIYLVLAGVVRVARR